MSKEIAKRDAALPALAMNEQELINVLQNSLYPGAQLDSIKLVVSYCKASGLDPMQKPVHIVPMYAATGAKDSAGKDIKKMRDVIMPGVGLYRTQAARSGQYAGVTEPEFGEDVTQVMDGFSMTFPKWCKVTVRRQMDNGAIVDFTAMELWKENYATAGRDSVKPNAMWQKRPYGQIAKCAEAQALRKAFPECGAAPTADEMEGKQIDDGMTVNVPVQSIEQKPALPECSEAKFNEMCADVVDNESGEVKRMGWKSLVKSGTKSAAHLMAMLQTKYVFSAEQIAEVNSWEAK